MNKTLAKFVLVFIIFGLTSCSYSPIFSEKNYNFEISEIVLTGEKDINKILKEKFNRIKNNQSLEKKEYKLLINSKKERKIVSKNSKGDPLKFELIITVQYEIIFNENLILEKIIEKNNIYNNDSDLFKLEQSEKIIIDNISGNISDNIISSIINLDDN
jgi:outer membrane lipopolysaccharide assembly protein LptE/RlpB